MKGGGALYDVRIGSYEAYQHFDVIVEYNMPNIENMRLSGHFDDLLPKVVYVPPLYFDEYQPQTVAAARRGHRGIGVLALMGFVTPRRHHAIQLMRNAGLEVAIVSNLTASNAQGSNVDRAEDLREALSHLLLRTRILVDLRTKEAYQTVNEFRLLPALQLGVVVVSEATPLIDSVPWREYVVWANYSSFAATVKSVADAYESIWDALHGKDSRLPELLAQMRATARTDLRAAVLRSSALSGSSCAEVPENGHDQNGKLD